MGLDPTLYHVEALLTTTRDALDYPKEIVDTYVELGCRALFLRPVDPFGFASKTGPTIEYPRREYLDFYREAVDYMLEQNRRGARDPRALRGDLPHQDPHRRRPELPRHPLALRRRASASSPTTTTARSSPATKGRMLHEMGDDMFLIGDAGESQLPRADDPRHGARAGGGVEPATPSRTA